MLTVRLFAIHLSVFLTAIASSLDAAEPGPRSRLKPRSPEYAEWLKRFPPVLQLDVNSFYSELSAKLSFLDNAATSKYLSIILAEEDRFLRVQKMFDDIFVSRIYGSQAPEIPEIKQLREEYGNDWFEKRVMEIWERSTRDWIVHDREVNDSRVQQRIADDAARILRSPSFSNKAATIEEVAANLNEYWASISAQRKSDAREREAVVQKLNQQNEASKRATSESGAIKMLAGQSAEISRPALEKKPAPRNEQVIEKLNQEDEAPKRADPENGALRRLAGQSAETSPPPVEKTRELPNEYITEAPQSIAAPTADSSGSNVEGRLFWIVSLLGTFALVLTFVAVFFRRELKLTIYLDYTDVLFTALLICLSGSTVLLFWIGVGWMPKILGLATVSFMSWRVWSHTKSANSTWLRTGVAFLAKLTIPLGCFVTLLWFLLPKTSPLKGEKEADFYKRRRDERDRDFIALALVSAAFAALFQRIVTVRQFSRFFDYLAGVRFNEPSVHEDTNQSEYDLNYIGSRLNREEESNTSNANKQPYFGSGEDTMPQERPWEILGVIEGASPTEIKRAYRARMKEYHPDLVANLGPDLRALAQQKTRDINNAYDVLMSHVNSTVC